MFIFDFKIDNTQHYLKQCCDLENINNEGESEDSSLNWYFLSMKVI